MHRRQLLRTSASAIAITGFGTTAGASDEREPYTPLGEVSITDPREVATTNDGTHAVVATLDGFAVLDVTDPTDPSVAAESGYLLMDFDYGPMEYIADVKIDDNRLLVSGPNFAPPDDSLVKAAVLYDISDPANPEQLDVLEVDHAIHNSFFVDGHAYLTISDFGYEGVKIVDASDDSLDVVTTFSIVDHDQKWQSVPGFLRSCHDLYVHGDYAYLAQWDAGTFILDVSDKSTPEVVGRAGGLPAEKLANVADDKIGIMNLEPPGNAHYTAVDDDASYLYVGAESWDLTPENGRRGASGITVWDISTKRNPTKLTTIHPPGAEDETRRGTTTTSHNFSLRGDRLYSSWYAGGVMIHDVSDPASPQRLAWWRQPSEASFWGAKVAGDHDFFVAGNMQGTVMTFPDQAGEMTNPPTVLTPPEETSIVTDLDWSRYTEPNATTTLPAETTAMSATTQLTTSHPPTAANSETHTADKATTVSSGASSNGGETAAPDTDSVGDDSIPGFGPLIAVGSLGAGIASRLVRRTNATEDE